MAYALVTVAVATGLEPGLLHRTGGIRTGAGECGAALRHTLCS
ncbi:hypothetical protein [Streptomyces sp. NPDC056663]